MAVVMVALQHHNKRRLERQLAALEQLIYFIDVFCTWDA